MAALPLENIPWWKGGRGKTHIWRGKNIPNIINNNSENFMGQNCW